MRDEQIPVNIERTKHLFTATLVRRSYFMMNLIVRINSAYDVIPSTRKMRYMAIG